jgi:hypothetical protein
MSIDYGLHRTKLSWFLNVILDKQVAVIPDPIKKNIPRVN